MKMTRNQIALNSGLIFVVVVSYLIFALMGPQKMLTGIMWGVALGYLGFVIYTVLLPSKMGDQASSSSILIYMVRSVLRIGIMVGVLCAVLFWLRVNSLGVLIGSFIGVTACTFVALFKIKPNVSSPRKT